MKNIVLEICLVAVCVVAQGVEKPVQDGEINVANFVKADGQTDVADALQKVILDHPNHTLYFPKGTYLLRQPICAPADPSRSVSFRLDTYAVLKADSNWTNQEAMVRIGGIFPYNTTKAFGADYAFTGGVIDGSGVATGLSIESGRQTYVGHVAIKNVQIGLHIKKGANGGSSDADIEYVNIEGNGKEGSIGVLNQAYDNTFSHMRINNVQIGVKDFGGGAWRDIHPLSYSSYAKDPKFYAGTIGFWIRPGFCTYDFCYSDNFATAFYIEQGGYGAPQFRDCWAWWYVAHEGGQYTLFKNKGNFNAMVDGVNFGGVIHPKGNYRLVEMVNGGKLEGGLIRNFRCTGREFIHLNDLEESLLK